MILPIFIAALGNVTKNLRKTLGTLDLYLGVDALQKICNLSYWYGANYPEIPDA